MYQLAPNNDYELILTDEKHEIRGTVKDVQLSSDFDYLDDEYDWGMGNRYLNGQTYKVTAEFVPNPETGTAYTIKELPVKKTVTHTAEVELDEYSHDFDAEDIQRVVKKARKRAGAPKGAQWNVTDFPIFEETTPVRIKFEWTETA